MVMMVTTGETVKAGMRMGITFCVSSVACRRRHDNVRTGMLGRRGMLQLCRARGVEDRRVMRGVKGHNNVRTGMLGRRGVLQLCRACGGEDCLILFVSVTRLVGR